MNNFVTYFKQKLNRRPKYTLNITPKKRKYVIWCNVLSLFRVNTFIQRRSLSLISENAFLPSLPGILFMKVPTSFWLIEPIHKSWILVKTFFVSSKLYYMKPIISIIRLLLKYLNLIILNKIRKTFDLNKMDPINHFL